MFNGGIFIDNIGPFDYTMRKDIALIDVTTLGDSLEIDPEWFHVDEKGHFHAFNMDNQATPTLKYVTETVDDGWDESSILSEHRCLICDAKVVPNYLVRHKPPSESIIGPTTIKFTIDRYTHDAHMGQQVSFYSDLMFGLARVTHVHVNRERMEALRFSVEFTCEFLAKRGSSGNL